MLRTYDRFASPPECAATANAGCGGGGGVIGANNAAIDHLRRRELETLSLDGSPHATTPDEMSATAPQLGDRGETPLQELEARELGGAIEHAIARLRPEYRTCILLRHVEGHSYEEIARILELPLGTVKTYIHRARNELRGYLEDRRE